MGSPNGLVSPFQRGGMAGPSHAGSLWSIAERLGVQPRTLGKEALEAAEAEAAAPSLVTGPPAVTIEAKAHIEAAQTDEECAAALKELKAALNQEHLFLEFQDQCDLCTYRRYLSARENDVSKAKELVLEALQWRKENLDPEPNFFELDPLAQQGALRVTGLDKYGRSVIVLDAGSLDRVDGPALLRFIAFTLEHAIRRMQGSRCEKFVIFLKLAKFRMATSPPRALLRDVCKMLSTCYPERCGNMIFHQAPRLFSAFFRLCSPFVDPRTAAKFIFVTGNDSPGSANDATLHAVVGTRWRSLARVEEETSQGGHSTVRDWADMLSFECAWRLAEQRLETRWQDEHHSACNPSNAPSEASTAPVSSRLSDLSGSGDSIDEDSALGEQQQLLEHTVKPHEALARHQLLLAAEAAQHASMLEALAAATQAAHASAQVARSASISAEKAAALMQSTAAVVVARGVAPQPLGKALLAYDHGQQSASIGGLNHILNIRIALWKVLLAALLCLGAQQPSMMYLRSFSLSSACAMGTGFCAGWMLNVVKNMGKS